MSIQHQQDQVRQQVREQYSKVAQAQSQDQNQNQDQEGGCCSPGCCVGSSPQNSLALGYSAEDLESVPEGANMGLGCGNPQAIARLKPGQVVLDLGSGGGFDCFLAARQVGPQGHVIGVDMTAEMVSKARSNAESSTFSNVEFRLGEIEHLPVEDDSVDVILSNCVINLSPDKAQVFREAYRVLKPGGVLAISDVLALQEIPEALTKNVEALSGCVSGATTQQEVEALLKDAGFVELNLQIRPESRHFNRDWFPGSGAENYIASATVEGVKGVGKHGEAPSRVEHASAREESGTQAGARSCCGPDCCTDSKSSGRAGEESGTQAGARSCCGPDCCTETKSAGRAREESGTDAGARSCCGPDCCSESKSAGRAREESGTQVGARSCCGPDCCTEESSQ